MTSTTPSAATSLRSATAKSPRAKNSTSSTPSSSPARQIAISVAAQPSTLNSQPTNDPETQKLLARIEDLETKLALYRRCEQLDLEILNLERRDGCMPIIRLVAREFIIPLEELLSLSKFASIAFARQVAMTLCREHTGLSFHELGRVFQRDHSAIQAACRAVRNHCDTDPTTAARLANLRTALK